MSPKQERIYTDELDAFAAVIQLIETIEPHEWIQGVSFGRWHPSSGLKGLYWNVSIARIVGSTTDKPMTPGEIEQRRQRGRDAAKQGLRDWQQREAEKAQAVD